MLHATVLLLLAFFQKPIDLSGPAPFEPIDGSLVIVGGGGTPEVVWNRFMQLAGGAKARIVYIPTATGDADTADPDKELASWRARNPASATYLHTRSRDLANSEAFVKPLRDATGVWFGGGDQSRITDAYLGTLVETELKALLKRGGVIGGTSAGAAIMTKVMITGGNPEATTGPGFGFLPGVVVDQHFLARNRMPRLIGVLRKNPGTIGFGIDEKTAMIIHNGNRVEILGESEVLAIQIPAAGDPMIQRFRRTGSY